MLDIGWSEMAIVAVVALFVIGPKDLPKALRTIGHYAGKVRAMAREFQSSIDEAVRETELDEVKSQIESVGKIDVAKSVENTIDPTGAVAKDLEFARFGERYKPTSEDPAKPEAEGAPAGQAGDPDPGAAAAREHPAVGETDQAPPAESESRADA